ncbi:MAG: NUDIX hydrolase [Candidatus Kerfeldbacteria bacterium]|nr:NUDIX hydrolase [Candidatus Kerfeldbacteria bacterium]
MTYNKANKLHIVAVTAVIRNREGRYLLLKRHPREITFPNQWCFPGGKVDGNDSVEYTLRKEVKEEAGLNLLPGKILLRDTVFTRPDGQTALVFTYLCQADDNSVVKLDTNDFTDYKWVILKDLKTLEHVGVEEEINQAEKLLALGVNLEKLFTPSGPREK